MGILDVSEASATSAGLGLVLLVGQEQALDPETVMRALCALDDRGLFARAQVLMVGPSASEARPSALDRACEAWKGRCRLVPSRWDAIGPDWNAAVRAGLAAMPGDIAVVVELKWADAPEAVVATVRALLEDEKLELAVAVPTPSGRRGPDCWRRSGLGWLARLIFGSAGVHAGLFAARRSLWEREGPAIVGLDARGLVLEMLARKPLRVRDVPVAPGPVGRGRPQRLGPRDARALKQLIDGRFGNLSRLVQFCAVGASGAVVDLSLYALFQWLLDRTGLLQADATILGISPLLAVAGAGSIPVALLWNFTLNRRLTFNDARRGRWGRQFLAYALSNALAIALNFSVRLYLPTRLRFFGRHRLAAALVGIVAATGVSFSMARWVVFTRRTGPAPAAEGTGEDGDKPAPARAGRASAVV